MKKYAVNFILLSSLVVVGCGRLQQQKNGSQTSETGTSTTINRDQETTKVTVEQAIESYQKEYPNTAITSLSLDKSFGTYYYEVQGVDDAKEYTIKVQAVDGTVIKEQEETLDQDEANGIKKQEDQLDLTALLPLAKISVAAEKAAKSGQAVEWALDKEMSILYWDVKVEDGQQKLEVKVNAKNAEILEVEKD